VLLPRTLQLHVALHPQNDILQELVGGRREQVLSPAGAAEGVLAEAAEVAQAAAVLVAPEAVAAEGTLAAIVFSAGFEGDGPHLLWSNETVIQ
jgi:hypothetical protein